MLSILDSKSRSHFRSAIKKRTERMLDALIWSESRML
jgi:hypothetical protein